MGKQNLARRGILRRFDLCKLPDTIHFNVLIFMHDRSVLRYAMASKDIRDAVSQLCGNECSASLRLSVFTGSAGLWRLFSIEDFEMHCRSINAFDILSECTIVGKPQVQQLLASVRDAIEVASEGAACCCLTTFEFAIEEVMPLLSKRPELGDYDHIPESTRVVLNEGRAIAYLALMLPEADGPYLSLHFDMGFPPSPLSPSVNELFGWCLLQPGERLWNHPVGDASFEIEDIEVPMSGCLRDAISQGSSIPVLLVGV